jgi:serine/threonine-protein kinase
MACKVGDNPNGGGSLTVIDIGTTLNQRFLLEKELGRGGMGAVYSATDQLLERKVAIKVLKEQSGEEVGKRLRLEAQIAARLLHENVVRIYDFGQADGTSFLVMEEVNGTSYSKRWRQLPVGERLQILAQVADALDYAHHQGVVHRDVKPGNVLLTASDVSKLSDFGLSMIAEQGDHTKVIRGTPHYMSPEQTRGGRLDYRTDLYSLGVMIYESSTGSVPFTGLSISIMSQHFSAVPERPRSRNPLVSHELEALILSLMAKRPEERPGSGAVVSQSLRQEVERLRAREHLGAGTASASAEIGGGPAYVTGTVGLTAPVMTQPLPAPTTPAANGPATGGASITLPASSSTGKASESLQTDTAPPVPSVVTVPSSQPVPTPGSGHSPSAPLAMATVASTGGVTAMIRSPLARRMLEVVLAEPVFLSPDERYLHGHYLAYLLSGSRRRGLFLRRPLEPRNADRGRLLLGLTYAITAGASEDAIRDAATLLDQRIEVRPILSPIVVAKYLACRDTPAKRKLFRQTRRAVGQASTYAQKRMIDAKGVLNPGLIPQRLQDLQLIAPTRTEIDDVLVERWNRVAEVWRDEVEFRTAVLRYATRNAHRDPASAALWPEVVYPLIERARWHRRIRTRTEAVWDYLSGRLHVGGAGVVLDRAINRVVPAPLVSQLDDSLNLLVDNPRLDDLEADPFAQAAPDETDRLTASLTNSQVSLADLAAEQAEAGKAEGLLQLVDPDPLRFLQGQLHELWKEALTVLETQVQARPGAKPAGHRHVPVGPYRLVVIPSIRGRAAGQIAIQGMSNKQIELSTPTVRTKGSAAKPLLAVWVYLDNSLAIVHLDFMNTIRYVLWHAPRGHQLNFDDAADLNHELYALGMEIPDQLDRVLSRGFKPHAR